jgi:hypothetical protein
VDNSIRLKELQVVSAALRKGDEGRMDQFHPFPKEFFFKGLEEVNYIWDGD